MCYTSFKKKDIIKGKLIILLILVATLSSCNNNKAKYEGLRKLSSEELIERAKLNNWPDINQVTYVMDNDTISFESVQKLNYNEIAFDDYVNLDGVVVLAEIRPITENDQVVRKKMNHVSEIDNLDGQLKTVQLFSTSLNQQRDLTIYQPQGSISNKIIYFTDGAIVEDIARTIHPSIINNELESVQLVGIHSDYEYRFQEYVKNAKSKKRFLEHLQFFTHEVPEFIEKETSNTERYLIGFSNGADFCNYLGIYKSDWMNKILALSGVAYFPSTIRSEKRSNIYPEFVITSGTEEELHNKNLQLKRILRELGADVMYQEFEGGHEYKIWRNIIINFIKDEFGK